MKKIYKTEILFGIHSVIEALKAGRRDFHEIYISKEGASSKRIFSIKELADQNRIPVKDIPATKLKSKTGSDFHQCVGALVSQYPVEDFYKITASLNSKSFLLIADGIQDPQNLGALLRTALCTGVNAVVIPKNRAAPPTPAVSRASAGALEHMLLTRVTNITDAIIKLKQKDVWIIGTDMLTENSVFSTDLTVPLAMVIGSEGKGIRPLVKKNCDLVISIPQDGPIGSLNASAAGAVIMYEVFRQRSICNRT
ncbi:MAG: 23S rRNA (guanosine(2251)-2'-O)-methyltransferase RlmB [Deltaproteobacteria bacterium]|nr:23S rRNA (guanosine(2251)-2'-O)-methyltransferase RlmB [Deltaproteobacteria bacterium]